MLKESSEETDPCHVHLHRCSCSVNCYKGHKEVCFSVPTQQEAAVDSFAKLLCPVDDSPLTEEDDTVEANVLERLSELVACISLAAVWN